MVDNNQEDDDDHPELGRFAKLMEESGFADRHSGERSGAGGVSGRWMMLLSAIAIAAACRKPEPVRRVRDVTVAVAAIDAGVPPPVDPEWPPGPTSLAVALGDAAFISEDNGAIVVRSRTGELVRTLVASGTSRATYDARVGIVWFLRNGRLEGIDLASDGEPVAIVDEMPDLAFQAGRGESVSSPMCDACVTVSAVPPAVGVTADAKASGGELQGEAAAQFERDHAIALGARPRLAATAKTFLARLGQRTERVSRSIELGVETWPLPRGARSQARCAGGCGRAFALEKLGWQLVVVGRTCNCLDDRCWGTCVLYDPARKRYATPSQPGAFAAVAIAERACHLALDAAGATYLLDHSVCTASGCLAVPGKILGWAEPGSFTGSVPEDISACPESP